ncbi:MAG: CocE/NonD family hydrolase, partial [Chitinophagaceae bacterium]
MKHLFSVLVLCCSTTLFAQPVALPKKISTLADVNDQITELAGRVLKVYQSADPYEYYDIIVRLEMAAGFYSEGLRYIDSVQQLIGISNDSSAAAVFFHYRCFALARMKPMLPQTNFESHFTEVLSATYRQLPETAKPIAETYFFQDTVSYAEELNKLIEDCRGKEQLELKSAVQLVRNWFALHTMGLTQRPAKVFFALEEEKKYFFTDSLLLTHNGQVSIPILVARSKSHTGPLPAVLMNNIYAGPYDRSVAKDAADKGYVGVIINTRGKRTSSNEVEPFEHDGEDINAVLDWLSTQPWFNGKAGMHGGSYLGFSQWAATKKLHPALKTIVPQVSVGFGLDFPKINGIFYTYMLRWLHYVTNNKLTDLSEFNNDERWDQLSIQWYTSGRPFRKLDSLEGRPVPLFQRWLDHPDFDEYWRSILPVEEDFSKINIPVLTTTGYFDDDQPGAIYYYSQHLKWNPK